MFKNLFKKSVNQPVAEDPIKIYCPIEGEVISIEDVPDPVFAQKMLGDGFAIKPSGNMIYAPVAGEIKVLFPTLHAIAIETVQGLEVLIHIGIDTVELEGEGFTSHTNLGDMVEVGDLLISFDKDIIEGKGKSSITPIVITNMDMVKDLELEYGEKKAKDLVASVVKK